MTRLMPMAAMAALLGGCLTTGTLDQPKGYLKIDPGPQYQQRYVSVDGNVMAQRTVPNPKGGTQEFWTKAIEDELTQVAGYTLKASEPIKAGRLNGTLMDFRIAVNGVEQTYLLAVYVQDADIALVEAGGQSEKIAADRDKLLAAMRSLR